jgi:hypothetical protein
MGRVIAPCGRRLRPDDDCGRKGILLVRLVVALCAQYRYAGLRGCDRRYEVISEYSGRAATCDLL